MRLAFALLPALALSAFAQSSGQMEIRCLSVVMYQGESRFFGLRSTLDIGTVWEGGYWNQELTSLLRSDLPTHGADFELNSPNGWVDGILAIDVPAFTDQNSNGIHDFFESSQAASSTTYGYFVTELDDGDVTAIWNRAAGSHSGTCLLQMDGATFGLLPQFTHRFEILEYSGAFTYARSESGQIQTQFTLAQAGYPDAFFKGAFTLDRAPEDRLNLLSLAPTTLTNEYPDVFNLYPAEFTRDGADYSAIVEFEDGYYGTSAPDFWLWFATLRDASDADGDGIPDLSDDPSDSVVAPRLAIRLTGNQAVLTVTGTAGATYSVERTASLEAPEWSTVATVSMATGTVELPAPLGEARAPFFWRAKYTPP